MEEQSSLLYGLIIPWALKILMAIAIFVIGRILARIATDLSRRAMTRAHMDLLLVNFLATMLFAVLMVCVAIAALAQMGLNVTSLLAILGAAGLAVGLALKDSLANIAAGIMIIIFKPFKLGDFVQAGGTAGVVQEIGLFQTVMTTPDNQRIILPNASITNSNIVNVNALPTRRIDMVFRISYGDDIEQARTIIRQVVDADERVLSDPAVNIRVSELADSSVDLIVRPWCNTPDYWALRWDLTERIKVALEKGGVTIPFPQRDIYVHQIDGDDSPKDAGSAQAENQAA